jgi:hypothetical protein
MNDVKPLVPWTYVYKHQAIDGPFWNAQQYWNLHTATESMPLYWGADVDALSRQRDELREALRVARDHIDKSQHGDNCYLTDEYPGNQCVCGKESLGAHLLGILHKNGGAS